MSFTNVCNITERYLRKRGFKDIGFEHGYTVLLFPDVKIFFYPGNDFLRITSIPIDRKYKILRDMNIFVEGLGNMFVKYQPNKTNSELMYEIDEKYLNDANIEKVATYMLNNTSNIFSKMEKQN